MSIKCCSCNCPVPEGKAVPIYDGGMVPAGWAHKACAREYRKGKVKGAAQPEQPQQSGAVDRNQTEFFK